MISVKTPKGYRLRIGGQPSNELESLAVPVFVAATPAAIPFIKPRLAVAVDDRVKVGSLLFVDKRNPDIRFLSPGGGRIEQINLGPRRVIREIVIRLDEDERQETFLPVHAEDLRSFERSRLIERILAGGLWPLIRALPFRDIADPRTPPPAIIVSLGSLEPFHPRPEVYLSKNDELFAFGVRILQQLAQPAPVQIATARENTGALKKLNGLISHETVGAYPSDDAGVLLYRTKESAAQNRAWFIDGQDVLLLAQLLKTGRYPTDRTMVVAGSAAERPVHVNTRLGVPLRHLAPQLAENGRVRSICGGVFRGIQTPPGSYMGLYERSLLLLPEGDTREFLALVRPGYRKPSYSRAFLSALNPAELPFDCNQHGEERACIGCMHCANVCPVDILPQLAYKAVLAGEVEEYLEHGLLDCVECGLCSYVCPAKIELTATLKSARADYARETS